MTQRLQVPILVCVLIMSPVGATAQSQKQLGANIHWPTVGFDIVHAFGGNWVRAGGSWYEAQPAPPPSPPEQAVYSWGHFHSVAEDAYFINENVRQPSLPDIQLLVGPGGTPYWASISYDRQGDGPANDIPAPNYFAGFVYDLVTELKDGKPPVGEDPGRAPVRYYSLWNEPNYSQFFEGDKSEFVWLVLKPGAQAVRDACCPEDPQNCPCKVVGPSLLSESNIIEWLTYILDPNQGNAAEYLDIIAIHNYDRFPSGEFDTTMDAVYAVVSQFAPGKPVWVTETGLFEGAPLSDPAQLEAQRQYFANVLSSMASRSWWTHTFFYEAFDQVDFPHPDGVAHVLPTYDPGAWGEPFYAKPAFYLLKQVTMHEPGFGGDGAAAVLDAASPFCDGEVVSHTLPVVLQAGQTYNASITFRNTGSYIWSSGGWYGSGKKTTWAAPFGLAELDVLPEGTSVQPGNTYTFQLSLTAPAAKGTYLFNRSLVRAVNPQSKAWFGASVDLWIDVTSTDPKPRVCGRKADGLYCARVSVTPQGPVFEPAELASSDWGDAYWGATKDRWGTISYPDLDGDGYADICGRRDEGVYCALALGEGGQFSPATSWTTDFSNGQGWHAGPWYWATIQFPDVNGDGKADVCGRGADGVWCALSTGSTFGALKLWQEAFSGRFSDGNGWTNPVYYGTIQFPDINGDGAADLCGRGGAGMWCAASDPAGNRFGTLQDSATLWTPDWQFSDWYGWNSANYYWATIQFGDIDGDGREDVCGRGSDGVWCAVAFPGAGFSSSWKWTSDFANPGWSSQPYYWATLALADVDGDGRDDICGREAAGITCAISAGSYFQPKTSWTYYYSDAHGWNASPAYWNTVHFADVDLNGKADVCGRGSSSEFCLLSRSGGFDATAPLTTTASYSEFGNDRGWSEANKFPSVRVVSGFGRSERSPPARRLYPLLWAP